jgi:hypothetical protein
MDEPPDPLTLRRGLMTVHKGVRALHVLGFRTLRGILLFQARTTIIVQTTRTY